ncbi:hypothetical protein GCM10009557_85860 [Virgisporangium ochraceum]|uniref:non-specific serine/threonine protein kinase n=1 Tax=Virgisporangium ochraceum TaxID=65505 RepID=A0A8J4EFZ6_9ACTN|nr:protein kinase [Virgisporangium ochraceum]GIJ70617.1 hypothetical protein Voc01_055340 [Virgisporangium ochraceum]
MTAVERGPGLAGYRDLVTISRTDTALVFEAVRDSDARRVAVKVLLVDHEVAERARAWRELTTTVLLSGHPHIVEILDTGVTARGNPYVVMEHCPDGSYERIVDRLGPLSVEETVLVGWRIAEALQAAHDVGVVHGAVRPSNILRAATGPALSDFGIARVPVANRLVEAEESPSSDLFDLAATMGHLLVGQPVSAGSVGQARRPGTPGDDVPEWLWFELDRGLAPDPDDRHPSAYAFAEILRAHGEYVAGAPARPEPPPFADDAIEGSLVLPAGVRAAPGYAEPAREEPRPPDGPRATIRPPSPPADDTGYPDTGGSYRWGGDDPDGDGPHGGAAGPDDGERRGTDSTDPAYPEPDRARDGYPDAFGDDPPWLDEPPRHRSWRTLLLGLAVAAMVGFAGFLFWPTGDGGDPGGAVPANSLAAVPPMRVTGEGAPTDVKLADDGSTITVTWSDATGKRAQFAVVGGPRGTPLTLQKVLDPGATSLTLQGLNTGQDYCFQVLAILRVDEYARSALVCTNRS